MNDGSYDVMTTAAYFGALADCTRLRLLAALMDGPACVCDLVDVSGVSQSAVSHQLRTLREVGLVTFERRGRHSYYSIADADTRSLLAAVHAHAAERALGGDRDS